LSLGCPHEPDDFLQKTVERKASFTEARYEAAESREASQDPLHPLYILNGAHPGDGYNLLWVVFDVTLRDDEP
jgi:hypothetical protein